MIAYIEGLAIYIGKEHAILKTDKIGYKIYLKQDDLLKMKDGESYAFYTSHILRENVNDLYGFASVGEVAFFETLISVSGVGPKSALAILNLDSLNNLKKAIANSDTTYLTRVSGIGLKTAKKLVLELQDKLKEFEQESWGKIDDDLVEALRTLGYDMKDIKSILGEIDQEIDTGEKVKKALQLLSK